MIETTFGIVKPDGVARGLVGEVVGRIERAGLEVVALKMVRMTPAVAAGFYAVHEGKPFFEELVEYSYNFV